MLEQDEIRRWQRLTAAMITHATDACPPEAGSPDAEAFAQVVEVLEAAMAALPGAAQRLRERHEVSWAELGRALGVTRSAVVQRFGRVRHDAPRHEPAR